MSEPRAVESAWKIVEEAMVEIRALAGASGVLGWDQQTYMPPGGAEARGEQLAAIDGAVHDRLTSRALSEALARLVDSPPSDPDRVAAVRELSRDVVRATAVPGELVRALSVAGVEGHEAWKAARDEERFERFAPVLGRLLALRREQAAALAPVLAREDGREPEAYDTLLDQYEPGLRVSTLEPLLARLTGWLVPLLDRIVSRPQPDDSFLQGKFEDGAQWRFTLELLELMGFERQAGRQDRSIHPFTMGADPGDVRVTTRIEEDYPLRAIFSTLHEGGHGIYEQQLPGARRRSVLCAAPSMGIHESQSRLWENQVGRSLAFWKTALPRLVRHFPQLAGVTPERFFRAVNRVERSLIRVNADEVSYNLHIVLRFELELALLRGKLAVDDLPAAWNERSARLLGLTPGRPSEGVLQDVHWSSGTFGYFPTYTIGNLYSASYLAAARRELPGLDAAIERGELAPMREWLGRKIHSVGRRRSAEEIARDVTGSGLTDADFRAYLEEKYLRELA